MFTQLVHPLDALCYIKDIQPHWNQACQDAFNSLKQILSNLPVLSLYNLSLPLLVSIDASQFGVGAVLYQLDLNNKACYIAFTSKALNPAQHNYPATKQEMLTILFTVCSFSSQSFWTTRR